MILAEWCALVTEANSSIANGKPIRNCQSQVIFPTARTQPFTIRLLSTLCLAGTFLINLFMYWYLVDNITRWFERCQQENEIKIKKGDLASSYRGTGRE